MKFNELSSKELSKKSGIYKLSCGGHIYIGSSKDLYSRLAEHRTDLFNKAHSNPILQSVCNKYGLSEFDIEIVEYCEPDIRTIREKHYIDLYNADMNLKDPITSELSESSRLKVGESVKKAYAEGRMKKKWDFTKVEVYNIWGDPITTYANKVEACEKLGITLKQLQRMAGGYKKGNIWKGMRFRYADSIVPVQRFDKFSKKIGEFFDFYYLDPEDNTEKFAFNDSRKVWHFLTDYSVKYPEKELLIIPKLKYKTKELRESAKLLNEDNANPSTLEIE